MGVLAAGRPWPFRNCRTITTAGGTPKTFPCSELLLILNLLGDSSKRTKIDGKLEGTTKAAHIECDRDGLDASGNGPGQGQQRPNWTTPKTGSEPRTKWEKRGRCCTRILLYQHIFRHNYAAYWYLRIFIFQLDTIVKALLSWRLWRDPICCPSRATSKDKLVTLALRA